MRAFALTIPGLGSLLADQARSMGIDAGPVEHDGRADVVPLASVPRHRPPIAELVCVELGRPRLEQLDARARRVVVRLQVEHGITRSRLRDRLTDARAAERELWVLQTSRHRVRVGRPIHRAPPAPARPGALRPAAAAAMIHLLDGPPGRLLDACAGAGTIGSAARAAGWRPFGGDVEPIADVRLDARRLPFADDTFAAAVANVPFGTRYLVQGAPVAWYRRTLTEMLRVAPQAVVLAPRSQPFRQALGRLRADLVARHDVVLLGMPTTMWSIRPGGGPAR